MDIGTGIAVISSVAGAFGGYYGGKRAGETQAAGIQSSAIEALKVRLDEQDRRLLTIPPMQEEILLLRGLVTQKANVDLVIEITQRTEEKIDELTRMVQRQSDGGGK